MKAASKYSAKTFPYKKLHSKNEITWQRKHRLQPIPILNNNDSTINFVRLILFHSCF